MKSLALAQVYLSLSARSAAVLGAPIFFGILVVSAIVFGPTGMRAADLVFTLRSAPFFAAALWLAWLILVFPVAKLALLPPSSLYLRWLPAPRSILYFSAALATFVVELPWLILFAVGESIFSGLAAAFAALALHAAATVRPLNVRHGLVFLGVTISVFVPNLLLALPLSFVMAMVAVKYAVDRAPEVHALAPGKTRVLPPALALARGHLIYLTRKEPAVLGRLLILASLTGLVIPSAARGFDVESPSEYGQLSLIVSAVFLSPGLAAVAASVIRSERLMSWLTDVLGTSAWNRTSGATIATAVIAIGSGIGSGLLALGFGRLPGYAAQSILVVPVIWGLVVASIGTSLARESESAPKRGDRGMVFALVMVIAGIVSAITWGQISLVVHVICAALTQYFAPRRALRIRRLRGTS